MRTRHRHHSEEITFAVKVAKNIQRSYGRPIMVNQVVETRVFETGFQSLTSQCPLHARFLDPVGFVLLNGGG